MTPTERVKNEYVPGARSMKLSHRPVFKNSKLMGSFIQPARTVPTRGMSLIPIQALMKLGVPMVCGCGFYIATAWLVTLFSRHLERLFEASRAAEEQQRSAIVAERTRFAREIHDSLAQGFTGIVIQLNAAEQRLGADSEPDRVHLDIARQLACQRLVEARRSVGALRPGLLANGNLLGAIEQIGFQLTAGPGVRFEAHLKGEPSALSDDVEAHLLRIGQEPL